MFTKRIIPCLDVNAGRVVKGVNFVDLQDAGDPVEIAKEYEESIPEFAYRLKVKAGLTGYAQIYGKYNTTAYDKLKLDLMYIESYSILEDLKLILATFKIVFTKESTEGLEEGQTISLNAKEEEKKDV